MKVRLMALRKSNRVRFVRSGKRLSKTAKRLRNVRGARRRRVRGIHLRRRRVSRRGYRLQRAGRVYFPASSRDYNLGYNQAYEEGFKSGFAQGYEDGHNPPASV